MKILWGLIVFFLRFGNFNHFRAKITRPIFEQVVLIELSLTPLVPA